MSILPCLDMFVFIDLYKTADVHAKTNIMRQEQHYERFHS